MIPPHSFGGLFVSFPTAGTQWVSIRVHPLTIKLHEIQVKNPENIYYFCIVYNFKH